MNELMKNGPAKELVCLAILISTMLTHSPVVQAKTGLCATTNPEAATCKSTKDCNDSCARLSKKECQYSCKETAISDPVTKKPKICKAICVDKTGSYEECGPGELSCKCSCKSLGSVTCGESTSTPAPYECFIARQCGIGSLGSTMLWCKDPFPSDSKTCTPSGFEILPAARENRSRDLRLPGEPLPT